jgi:hypothetical protein
MSFCNSYKSLGVISIILIISIVILILYKQYKDEKQNTSQFDNIEPFGAPTAGKLATPDEVATLFANNVELASMMNELKSQYPELKTNTKFNIDTELQNSIAAMLNSNTDNIVSNTSNSSVLINSNIVDLQNQITDLENIVEKLHLKNINNKNISKIKSLNNGFEIALSQTPNTMFRDPQSGVNLPGYMVNVNNGCLSVGATEYNVYKCNDKNPKHLFKMAHIINEQEYEKHIDKAIPFDNVDKTTINYPFALIKSVNNQNCLTNTNGNITVQPCYSYEAQRWMPM